MLDFMDYLLNEKTFFVKEIFNPQLNGGAYNYYIVKKKNLSHKQLLKRLPNGFFCGIKDKNATTEQWFCTIDEIDNIHEENLEVTFKGTGNEKLWIGKHKGNSFKVKVDLNEKDFSKLKKFNSKKELIANYFGKQRFDKRVFDFSNAIEKKEFEKALKLFLCEKSEFDSEKSSLIKKEISEKWGKWKELIESDVIPKSKKGIFESLSENKDFEKAFDFVERKSLKFLLKACQSLRFNELLEKEVETKVENNFDKKRANKNMKKQIIVECNKFEKKFKIKNLERNSYFGLEKFKVKKIGKEYWLEFFLKKGCYATITLELFKEYLKE